MRRRSPSCLGSVPWEYTMLANAWGSVGLEIVHTVDGKDIDMIVKPIRFFRVCGEKGPSTRMSILGSDLLTYAQSEQIVGHGVEPRMNYLVVH